VILFGYLALSDTVADQFCYIPISGCDYWCYCSDIAQLLSLRQQVMGTVVLDKSAFVLLALITMLIKELSNTITRSNHPTPQLTLSRYPLTSGLKEVHTCPQ